MEASEIEQLVEDLESRIDRLRSLYDQYFVGIEKLEPLVARKDVDRRFQVLRREQIRNTGVRFRFQMLVQKYGTYQTYWQRVARQIEEGTYSRHVLRAEKKLGRLTTARGPAIVELEAEFLEEAPPQAVKPKMPPPVPMARPHAGNAPHVQGAPQADLFGGASFDDDLDSAFTRTFEEPVVAAGTRPLPQVPLRPQNSSPSALPSAPPTSPPSSRPLSPRAPPASPSAQPPPIPPMRARMPSLAADAYGAEPRPDALVRPRAPSVTSEAQAGQPGPMRARAPSFTSEGEMRPRSPSIDEDKMRELAARLTAHAPARRPSLPGLLDDPPPPSRRPLPSSSNLEGGVKPVPPPPVASKDPKRGDAT